MTTIDSLYVVIFCLIVIISVLAVSISKLYQTIADKDLKYDLLSKAITNKESSIEYIMEVKSFLDGEQRFPPPPPLPDIKEVHKPKVTLPQLYKSLGLEYEDEVEKLQQEKK